MSSDIETSVVADAHRSALTRQIDDLLARLHPTVAIERRRDERIAIPVLLSLTPLDVDRDPIESETTIVVGKNISRRGLCFFHERPMSYRHAIVALAQPGLGSFAAEIDISWCCFTSPGWYESGGRLVRAATPLFGGTGSRSNGTGLALPAGVFKGSSGWGPQCQI